MSVEINTSISENELTNMMHISSRYIRGRNMDINKYDFEYQQDDIIKFQENLLVKDIRKDIDKDLIDKYSSRFEAILNDTELYANGSPLDTQVRLKLESCLMDFLFEFGFSARLINDIQRNMDF